MPLELFNAAFSRNGADLLIGRRLAGLYREAGLEDIGARRERAPTGPVIPAARSAPTWCAACAR